MDPSLDLTKLYLISYVINDFKAKYFKLKKIWFNQPCKASNLKYLYTKIFRNISVWNFFRMGGSENGIIYEVKNNISNMVNLRNQD